MAWFGPSVHPKAPQSLRTFPSSGCHAATRKGNASNRASASCPLSWKEQRQRNYRAVSHIACHPYWPHAARVRASELSIPNGGTQRAESQAILINGMHNGSSPPQTKEHRSETVVSTIRGSVVDPGWSPSWDVASSPSPPFSLRLR